MNDSPDTQLERDFLLHQYDKLREEIYHRTYIQQQLVTIGVLGAGAVLTVGAQQNARLSIPALLLYPFPVTFLAVAWSTQYAAIRMIGAFIARLEREVFVKNEATSFGWETLVRHSRLSIQPTSAFLSGWLDAKGIFVGLQMLALGLAFARSGFSVAAVLLFVRDPHVLRPYLWPLLLGLLDLVAVGTTLSLPGSHPAMRQFVASVTRSPEPEPMDAALRATVPSTHSAGRFAGYRKHGGPGHR